MKKIIERFFVLPPVERRLVNIPWPLHLVFMDATKNNINPDVAYIVNMGSCWSFVFSLILAIAYSIFNLSGNETDSFLKNFSTYSSLILMTTILPYHVILLFKNVDIKNMTNVAENYKRISRIKDYRFNTVKKQMVFSTIILVLAPIIFFNCEDAFLFLKSIFKLEPSAPYLILSLGGMIISYSMLTQVMLAGIANINHITLNWKNYRKEKENNTTLG